MTRKIKKTGSFTRDNPRNEFENHENFLIRVLFAQAAGNTKIEMAAGNLILHYRTEIDKIKAIMLKAAQLIPSDSKPRSQADEIDQKPKKQ